MQPEPDLERIQRTVEDLLAAETARTAAVREELQTARDAQGDALAQIRRIVESEREMLADLDELLETERARIDELEAAAAHLHVEQAVRNRDTALRKLREHNEQLQAFHDALAASLDAVTKNLRDLEASAVTGLEHDAEPHLREARDALEAHNDAIGGLGKHLRILAQYLL